MNQTALAKFLEQRGITPTGDRKSDLELARPFFVTYKQHKETNNAKLQRAKV